MARVGAVLAALGRVLSRDLKTSWSFKGNNFFIVSLLVMRQAGGFIYLIIGLVMLFPLSTDPLSKIPASRLALWPLDRRDRWVLRLASPWLNPMTWLIAGLAGWVVRGNVTVGFWGLFAGLVAGAFALSSISTAPGHWKWRHVPQFPSVLNHLIRKNLREMVSTLDFYCALALSVSAFAYRVAMQTLPDEALIVITILVVLALSSYAQSLFGLDGPNGLLRYRLLPLRGWQVLAAKDAAFLIVVVVLTAPLAPLPGMSAGLAALAVGHRNSVTWPAGQVRWRFSPGAPFFPDGIVQSAAIVLAGWLTFDAGLTLIPCVAAWANSLWWYGRRVEQMVET